MRLWGRFICALSLVAGLCTALPAQASSFLQCAPYARETSGIQIFGNAGTWWDQAAGKYERGQEPQVGAVLAFRSTSHMRVGHVAVVSKIVDDRHILLDHANWSYPGKVEHGVMAVDVSAAGDWSDVKVWYAPIGDLGTRDNPTYGFIYADAAPTSGNDLQLASSGGASVDSNGARIQTLR